MMAPRKLRTVMLLSDGAHELVRLVVPHHMFVDPPANDNSHLAPVA